MAIRVASLQQRENSNIATSKTPGNVYKRRIPKPNFTPNPPSTQSKALEESAQHYPQLFLRSCVPKKKKISWIVLPLTAGTSQE